MRKLLVLLLLLSSCKQEPEVEPIRPVRVYKVVSPEQMRERTFSGTAKASEESSLSFKVPGTITSINVSVGDPVAKGQILATLNPLDYQFEMQRAEAELAKAEANRRNADANYERIRLLYETRTASRADLDDARAKSEAARASVSSAEKELSIAKRDLSYTHLLALSNGAIAEKKAEVNENVQSGQTILTMVSGTQPEVDIQMPELLISYVTQDYPIEARFSALPNQVLHGKVIHIGVATTGTSTTFPVTLLIDDPEHQVRSGMAAHITFKFPYNPETDLVEVPSVAVGEDLEGKFVYVVTNIKDGIGVVERRPVVTGKMLDQKIVIEKGLEGDELVVMAGVDHIKPGMEVRIYTGKGFD